jgi:hypothetical protein
MKEYKIIRVVNNNGIAKYEIHYYIDGFVETAEAYYGNIKEGFILNNNLPITSNLDGITEEENEYNIKVLNLKEVQLWRLRTILKLMNLEVTIESALDELDEPNKTAAKNVWNYGTTVERYSQTVLFIQSVLGLTDKQTNEIFIQAEAIQI